MVIKAIIILGIALMVPSMLSGRTITVVGVSTTVAESISEPEIMTAYVTAYTSDPSETDDSPFITASQTRVRDGVIACPRRFPFGSRVEIEGKEYVCEDRMHPRYTDRFDVWMAEKNDALEWGKRKLQVKIHEPI